MRWLNTELLAACLAFGCGSAMGGPSQGSNPYRNQNQNQSQNQNPNPNPNQDQAGWDDSSSGWNDNQRQQPRQDQQPQRSQAPQGQGDTVVESFEWASGGTHLGVVIEGMTQDLRQYFGAPSDRGVLVAHVVQGSPAARAGIRVGDVLLDVGNRRIRGADDVISALAMQQGGQLPLEVIRQGRRMRLDAYLPNPQQQNQEEQPHNDPML